MRYNFYYGNVKLMFDCLIQARGKWGSSLEFILTVIGYAVGKSRKKKKIVKTFVIFVSFNYYIYIYILWF